MDKLNLYKKLYKARKDLEAVYKTKNANERYATVKSEDVMSEIRKVCDEAGLIFIPQILSSQQQILPEKTTGQGNTYVDIQISFRMQYKVIDIDSGEEIICEWYAIGQDKDDTAKAGGKALTYYEKYFMMKLFQISINSDDPDVGLNQTSSYKPKLIKKLAGTKEVKE